MSQITEYRPRHRQAALTLPVMNFVLDNASVAELNQEKQQLIENLVSCGYTEQELSSKPLGALRGLAKRAKASAPAPSAQRRDYSALAPVASESNEQEPLLAPAMNFSHDSDYGSQGESEVAGLNPPPQTTSFGALKGPSGYGPQGRSEVNGDNPPMRIGGRLSKAFRDAQKAKAAIALAQQEEQEDGAAAVLPLPLPQMC